MQVSSEKIEYCPYKSYRYAAMLVSIITLIPLFIFMLILLCSGDCQGVGHMMIPFSVITLIVMLCGAESKRKIIFTKEAIYTQRNLRCNLKEYRYDTYLFAYYCKHYKGQLFLVLSECELERKQVKRIVFWGGGIGATFYDSCVIIYIDENNKQIGEVKKHISENVKNIYKIGNIRS